MRLSIVLSTGAPAFTNMIIFLGRIKDSQNSLGYMSDMQLNNTDLEVKTLSPKFSSLDLNSHSSTYQSLLNYEYTFSRERLEAATLKPFEAMLRAKLVPITPRPYTPISQDIIIQFEKKNENYVGVRF